MADMTVAEALLHAPASSDKTALDAALDVLVAALDTAATNEALSDIARIQLKMELVDWAERLGSELEA